MDAHTVVHRLAETEELIKGVPEELKRDARIAVLTALLVKTPTPVDSRVGEAASAPAAGGRKSTLQDFVKQHVPKTHHERIGVIAFYSTRFEAKPFITGKEIKDSYTLCGFRKPPDMCEAIRDARRRAGYVKSVGMDKFVVTPRGENLILDLEARVAKDLEKVNN